MTQRLSKVLAAAGVASRRHCEEIIFSGRVIVNGQKVIVPQTMVSFEKDRIEVDGHLIKKEERKLYLLLNKPAGFICSNQRFGKKTKLVLDLFGDLPFRLFTVGRLDKETSGLLLITNDGTFAQNVIHPSSNVSKEYVAKCVQEITPEHLKAISKGVWVEGIYVIPTSVKKVRRGTVKITVKEGKKREVRELLDNAGLKV
ncbi:MAG: Ribosomal large subunit pseudouridine synthase B, partial [Chlamydiae bacterium]|nr:Ribosomal large subunit pseudouridine synthase B [Chlamydiota bacterium]